MTSDYQEVARLLKTSASYEYSVKQDDLPVTPTATVIKPTTKNIICQLVKVGL
jgi:hypothetical protein